MDLRDTEKVDIQSSANDLSVFHAESVDAIHCNSLILHLPDLPRAISEWLRVLKPGRTLVVKATHANSIGIVQDPDHHNRSWTSWTPQWFNNDNKLDYYSDSNLTLESAGVDGWLRPERKWSRPLSWFFGRLIDAVATDVTDELTYLLFAGEKVEAYFQKAE